MRILLHVCCCHCLARTLVVLRAEFGADLECHLLWFNPNIHPLIEYRRRLKAFKMYLERDPLPHTIIDHYGVKDFCRAAGGCFDAPGRCAVCYRTRLTAAAERMGAEFDAFGTTLMASREQPHAFIQKMGAEAAAATGKTFFYRDCSQAEPPAKLMTGLYKQSYCGCVFSEEDRYRFTRLHLYPVENPKA